jgi:hypothetical protein
MALSYHREQQVEQVRVEVLVVEDRVVEVFFFSIKINLNKEL